MSAVRSSSVNDAGSASLVVTLPAPYLLFLGDTTEPGYAKTAFGLRDWAGELCIGEFACADATVSTGLRWMTPREAHSCGARSLVIGVANTGGVIKPDWIPCLVTALEAGLDIVSGMHGRLEGFTRAQGGRRAPRAPIDRRAPTAAEHSGRDRPQAQRQASAHRRHGLCARQEIHGAGTRGRVPASWARCGFSRNGSNRHHDRGQRHADGRHRLGLRGRARPKS